MGIRCLQSFVEEYFRGWKKNQVIKGKLIVDITAVLGRITAKRTTKENEKENAKPLCGGDYVSFSREISRFFQALVDAGISPIIVPNQWNLKLQ